MGVENTKMAITLPREKKDRMNTKGRRNDFAFLHLPTAVAAAAAHGFIWMLRTYVRANHIKYYFQAAAASIT